MTSNNSSSSSMKGKMKMPDFDPYQVLGLDFAALQQQQQQQQQQQRQSTSALIQKAYRKLALQYHPDKNRTTKSESEQAAIAERFHQIKEARTFLLDPDYMAIKQDYDRQRASTLRRQQQDQERNAQLSSHRKRMRDELVAREREAAATTTTTTTKRPKNKQQQKRTTLSSDDANDDRRLHELRKQGQQKRQEATEKKQYEQEKHQQRRNHLHTRRQMNENEEHIDIDNMTKRRQVRLKWSRKRWNRSNESPSEDFLAQLLSQQFGAVESVEMIQDRKGKGNQALVTFVSAESCPPCVEHYETSNQMRATFVLPPSPSSPPPASSISVPPKSSTTIHPNQQQRLQQQHDDENLQQRSARQASERERLIQEMMQQDGMMNEEGHPVNPNFGKNSSSTQQQQQQQQQQQRRGMVSFPLPWDENDDSQTTKGDLSPAQRLMAMEKMVFNAPSLHEQQQQQ